MPPLEQTELASSVLTSRWVVAPEPDPSVGEYHNGIEQERKYPTGFGAFSFEELYDATNRIVGFTLRGQVGMTNPEDIDDCMQTGYLKVWEQLQKQPNLFERKPKKYIVQAVVLRSKAQRYAHLRHYRKIVFDADPHTHQTAESPTIAQIETWIDLARAIQHVAEYVATHPNPIYLIALYTLITDVKIQNVAKTAQYGVSTLTTAKRRVRTTFAKALPDYGNPYDCAETLPLPKVRSFPLAQLQRQLISPILFEDAPLHPIKRRELKAIALPNSLVSQRQITHEPYIDRSEPTYKTRWNGNMTLEALLADRQVRKVAFAKMRSLGYTGEDAQDCFQLGTINLWKALQKQPELLSDKGSAWVGIWIAYSGSRRSLWKHKARGVSFDDLNHDWHSDGERDELHQHGRPERWASWATRVDQRIDFAMLMNALAQQYADDSLKLFALYSLTTSVRMKDVMTVAKADKNQIIQARNQVKHDIRQKLAIDNKSYLSDDDCLVRLQSGECLECVTRVAEQVQHNQHLLLALYIVTTSATRKAVSELFDIKLTAFRKEVKQIKCLLAQAFRQTTRR